MLKRASLVLISVLILGATWPAQADMKAGLVGWWQFEEGSGVVVNDRSGNEHHGTIGGTPQWGDGPDGFGGAVDFSDTTGGDCGVFDPTDGTGTFTLTLWCLWDGTQTIQHFLTKSNGWGATTAMFQIEVKGGDSHGADQQDRLHLACSGATQAVLNLVPHNEWTHLALVFDGTYATGYANGGDAITSSATSIGPNVDAPVIIGASHPAEGRTFQGLLDDVRIFSRPLSQAEVLEAMLSVPPTNASEPSPEDEAVDVWCDTTLGWMAGELAATHDVYLGTVFDDVNDASRSNPMDLLISQDQSDTICDPGRLAFDQTYYWRVDEVNAAPDNTIFKGGLWSFTTEPLAYPIGDIVVTSNSSSDADQGPENTVNGSGLNDDGQHSPAVSDMWLGDTTGLDAAWIQFDFDGLYQLHEIRIWNHNSEFESALGFGVRNVTLEYSTDGVEWTVFGDVDLAQATGLADYTANTIIEMQKLAARSVRLTLNANWSGRVSYGLSEVQFMYIPVQARLPEPADGATDVDVATELTWRAGREAASHQVYLDSDAEAVADDSALVATIEQNAYVPGDLNFGSVYYWKVTEVNDAEAVTAWESHLWTFATREYGVVEDFEAYDDEDNVIYEAWIDGWTNGSCSTVGYLEAPFAEHSIVNGGFQSMPLIYDNSESPYYAEAFRTWSGGLDLTAGGADSLQLYFHGAADNEAEILYVAVEDRSGNVAVVSHDDAEAALVTDWQAWRIPFGALAGVNMASVETIYIGLGDRDNPSAGGAGTIYIDDLGFGTPLADSN